MFEKADPDMDVGYEGIAGAPCRFISINEHFEVISNTLTEENINF